MANEESGLRTVVLNLQKRRNASMPDGYDATWATEIISPTGFIVAEIAVGKMRSHHHHR